MERNKMYEGLYEDDELDWLFFLIMLFAAFGYPILVLVAAAIYMIFGG